MVHRVRSARVKEPEFQERLSDACGLMPRSRGSPDGVGVHRPAVLRLVAASLRFLVAALAAAEEGR